MTHISFFVEGEPKAQPRPKAFARKFGGKFMARVYDPGTAEHWKSQIAVAAKAHRPETPLDGPIECNLTFVFPRPKKHYRTGSTVLRSDAPVWHVGKPDRDNLDKAVMDCLTALGFWTDDSRVCAGQIRKVYVSTLWPRPGAQITIREIDPLKFHSHEPVWFMAEACEMAKLSGKEAK